MTQYTGANVKARALIALAENPLDVSYPNFMIVKNEAMNEFDIHLSMANISYLVNGVLPMSDLPEIEQAICANGKLQALWLDACTNDVEYGRQINLLHTDMNRVANERYDQVQYKSPEKWREVRDETSREYEPRISALKQQSVEAKMRVQPGLAAVPDLRTYIDSIEPRAAFVAGISMKEEMALFRAPDSWHQQWQTFIDATAQTAYQRTMLGAFKNQSEARILIDRKVITGVLSQVGDARKAFDPALLEKCMRFSNQMACKRAFFNNQGMQPVDTEDEIEEEAETSRP